MLANVFWSVVTTLFSTRVISLLPMKPLFVRKGLINFQKLLLMFILFSVMLFNCFFKDFPHKDTRMFFCFLYANTFSLEGFYFVFQFASCVDRFLKSLVTKGDWLPLKTFFFHGTCLFTTSRNLFEINE